MDGHLREGILLWILASGELADCCFHSMFLKLVICIPEPLLDLDHTQPKPWRHLIKDRLAWLLSSILCIQIPQGGFLGFRFLLGSSLSREVPVALVVTINFGHWHGDSCSTECQHILLRGLHLSFTPTVYE